MPINKDDLRGSDMSASSTPLQRAEENTAAPPSRSPDTSGTENQSQENSTDDSEKKENGKESFTDDSEKKEDGREEQKKGKDGTDRALDAGQSAVNSGPDTSTGDTATDETQDAMNQGLNSGINDAREAKRGYDNIKKLRQNLAEKKAGKEAGKKAAEKGAEAAAEKGAGAAAEGGKAAAKGAGKAIGTAAKGLGKAALAALKGLIATPAGWIMAGIIIILIISMLVFYAIHNKEEKTVAEGNYTTEYTNDSDAEIKQTWTGVYYQKYADMGIYAQVDTSSISKGNADICPDAGNGTVPSSVGGESGVDACSGETFQQLSGTSLGDISQTKLYQEGTEGWSKLNIQDANNMEDYIGISAGSLSLLDRELNGSVKNPGQFIKPVYADCMKDLDAFLADPANDADEDGQVTIKDCAVRKYDKNGNPVDIDKNVKNGDDASLYLSFAESTAFDGSSLSNSKAVIEKDEDGNIKKTQGQWDYGLGTLAHYVAVYQPSRVTNYNVDNVQYVCDGDGTSNGASVAACAGAKFGDVVAENDPTHSGGVDTSQMESVYADAYVPASTLYYRDWHVNGDSFDADARGEIYSGSSGEYRSAGIDRSQWKYEPALSTGVPQTEVKYVIDKAVTFAGEVKFDISQDWVTETSATHEQKIAYSREKGDLGSVEEEFPSIGRNTELVENFSVNRRCLYYGGSRKACGFNTGDRLTWVAEGKRYYTEKKTVSSSGGDKVEKVRKNVPAHFEDAQGNMYMNGAVVGRYTSKKAKKKMGNTADDRSAYQWGASISATIVISKTGDLQTYAVKYTSAEPKYADSTRTSYLKQYILNYASYVKDSSAEGSGNTWKCYGLENSISSSDASDYGKAKDVKPSGTLLKEIADLSGVSDDTDRFCYSSESSETIESLKLNRIPSIQYTSFAGRLGYTLRNLEQSKENITPVENGLKTSLGQSKDNQLLSTLAKTDPYGQSVSTIVSSYSGQYGVDSSLLALIIAEENSGTGNVTGVPAGKYTAYNISTRARATEHSGGSSKSADTRVLSGVVNFIRQMFGARGSGSDGQSVNVGDNSKETITVTDEQLTEGGMLKDNGSGGVSVTTYSAANAAAISSGTSLANAQTVYSILKEKGYSDTAIAGALGNFQQESSVGFATVEAGKYKGDVMDKNALDAYTKNTVFAAYGSRKLNREGYRDPASGKYLCGLGLVQWTGGRAGKLIDYASSKGGEWTTPSIQLDFMFSEIDGSYSSSPYYSDWKNAKTPEAAAAAWYRMYESGGAELKGKEKEKREGYAQTYYQKISTGGITATASSSSSETGNITNSNSADIVETTDNEDVNWDPSDPWFGQSPELGGTDLLKAVDDDGFGTAVEIDVYPSMGTEESYTPGVLTARNAAGDEKVFLVSSGVSGGTAMDYAAEASPSYQNLPADSMVGLWSSAGSDGYTPLAVKLTDSVSITGIPYTSKDRSTLKKGAYQYLIDRQPGSQGNFELALHDLIWLYSHTDQSSTTWKIRRGESYFGYIPSAVEKATEATVKVMDKANISAGTSNVKASTVSVMSGAALSTKVAAMKLQTLQVRYGYNVPMILTAYGLGTDFMDAVLECYENETGIDPQSAIEDTRDTAWADYRKYVYDNPDTFNITVPSSKTYDYAEKVLSRMNGTKIYYQKIDLRYDREKNTITAADNTDSDSSQHTIALWDSSRLYDSIADSNSTKSLNNQAHVNRAIRALNRESGEKYITESQWKDLTSGQADFPDAKCDTSDSTKYYDADATYLRVSKDLADDSARYLISRMMRFGTDEREGEEDYSSDGFVQSKISRLLGNRVNSWTSSISTEELFGFKELDTSFSFRSFTDDGYLVSRKYGYRTDAYGDRNYRPYVTYQDSSRKSGDVYSPFDGTVTDVGEDSDYGKFVSIRIKSPNSREDLILKIGNLKEVYVKEGDSASEKIGTSDDKGVFFGGFYVGGDVKNLEDVIQAIADATPDFGDSDTGGIGGVTTNARPANVNVASLEGVTWKDLLGPNAPSSPSQYSGHKTWAPGGLLMANGFGGDLPMPEGSPIYAPVDGWVAACDDVGGSKGGKSNIVIFAFKGDDGFTYTINVVHIENGSCSAAAANGGIAAKGTQIAAVGQTGMATGPHAHVYMNRMGDAYDPSDKSLRLTRAGCSTNSAEPCGVQINSLFNY